MVQATRDVAFGSEGLHWQLRVWLICSTSTSQDQLAPQCGMQLQVHLGKPSLLHAVLVLDLLTSQQLYLAHVSCVIQ